MYIEVSIGELVDKISILEIKLLNIKDKNKLINVKNELSVLNPHYVNLLEMYGKELSTLYLKLSKVNKKLWVIEDELRELESKKDFGDIFVNLARSVYITNDERANLKKDINLLTNSSLVEEKSYKDYQ